jgi:hypothetical protein
VRSADPLRALARRENKARSGTIGQRTCGNVVIKANSDRRRGEEQPIVDDICRLSSHTGIFNLYHTCVLYMRLENLK